MPDSNTEELGRFLKCTVIGRGVFGPCACCNGVCLPQIEIAFQIKLIPLDGKCSGNYRKREIVRDVCVYDTRTIWLIMSRLSLVTGYGAVNVK